MKKWVKRVVEGAALAGVVLLLIYVAVRFATELRSPSSPGMEIALYGAFAGALSAFLLVQLGSAVVQYVRSIVMYLDSLEALEREIRIRLSVSGNNRYIIAQFKRFFSGVEPSTRPMVVWTNRLLPFPQLDSLPPLRSKTLQIQLTAFKDDLRKLNASMEMADRTYDAAYEAYKHDTQLTDDYVAAVREVESMHDHLMLFLAQFEADGIAMLALIRLLREDESPVVKFLFRSGRSLPDDSSTRERFQSAVNDIQQEVREAKSKSNERIQRLLSALPVKDTRASCADAERADDGAP